MSRRFALALCLTVLTGGLAWAQDESADVPVENAPQPSMQDVLNALEHQPASTDTAPASTDPSPGETPTAPQPSAVINAPDETPTPNSYIVPPDDAAPTASTEPNSAIVPTRPLENMNPALMPQTPVDEAPKAVRAETPPVPPKPPAYEPQPYITLQTLDKVTARTDTLTVKVGDTVAIGPLFVQVKICQQAAPLETPDSAAFLEIWEAKPKDTMAPSKDNGPSQWVFSGWMFASSPALSAMDHPIYDIWVLNCKKSANDAVEKSAGTKAETEGTKPASDADSATPSKD